MLYLLRLLVARTRRNRLERLIALATRVDEVLMTSALRPETRRHLEGKREELEEQIQALLGNGTVVV